MICGLADLTFLLRSPRSAGMGFPESREAVAANATMDRAVDAGQLAPGVGHAASLLRSSPERCANIKITDGS